jgi:glycerate 2-kinase
MPRSAADLRSDTLAIWHAGLDAVRSDRLVRQNIQIDGGWLLVGEESVADTLRVPLASIARIAVVGAGKAGAGMASGLLQALGPNVISEKQVTGWLNVPADCVTEKGSGLFGGSTSPIIDNSIPPKTPDPLRADCLAPVAPPIRLHAARPAGINEPTTEGITGTDKILEIVSSLGPNDLCFCLLSGGGSALLPAPVPGVSLAEKQAITRELSAAGANIQELNTVRKQLSRVKGGGLARACRAGRLITLIISDVLGDPLDVIASGPTVPDTHTPADALAILDRYHCGSEAIRSFLRRQPATHHSPLTTHVTNLVVGNNALAVDAAGIEAERRGYSHAMHASTQLEGPAEEIGRDLARMTLKMSSEPGPDCLITGGEPTVKLAPPDIRGKGGRNQQLVLAALSEILDFGFSILDPQQTNPKSKIQNSKFCLLSAGTDGEDGPTDAAGAIIDADTISSTRQLNLDPADYLRRTDAYHFFEATGGLIKTGPTHTNVCDVRVVVVDRGA